METGTERRLHPAWGFIALGFYVTHAIALFRIGVTAHLLWLNSAAVFLGIERLFRRARGAGSGDG
ncbi:MAG: hypothetical protein ABFS86_07715 [Planctomycetota bacterium]